jgi:hypothetical protein
MWVFFRKRRQALKHLGQILSKQLESLIIHQNTAVAEELKTRTGQMLKVRDRYLGFSFQKEKPPSGC